MADVFISYARADHDKVLPIVRAVRNAGYSLWWDQRIHAGAAWRGTIERELDAAKCVLVIWSAKAAKSRWTLAEAERALTRNAYVPVTLDGQNGPLSFEGVQPTVLAGWSGDRRNNPWPQVEIGLAAKVGRAPAPWVAGENEAGLPQIAMPPVDPASLLGAIASAAVAGSLAALWLLMQEPSVTPKTDFPSPEMVRVAGGEYAMGSGADEPSRAANESPRHQVRIRPFALGRTEVTWDEWLACVGDGGCDSAQSEAAGGDAGWGRGPRPVINVSWEDANDYVRWLSEKTGLAYRLPTEAEWEYAARAGAVTSYAWGDAGPKCDGAASNGANFAVCTDDRTRPVASFPANGFGLHDMAGNVWEWVEDCAHGDYRGAPDDGSAWITDCTAPLSHRIVRGGSWADNAPSLRAARRYGRGFDTRDRTIGFRVARSL